MFDAAEANDSALVLKLLKQGAELEWRHPYCDGMTALAIACYAGSYEAAEALCAHGAELDTRSDDQWTPLMPPQTDTGLSGVAPTWPFAPIYCQI